MACSFRSHRTALVALTATWIVLGCTKQAPLEASGFASPRPSGALEVRLVFGEEADLDLFVSDPRKEALYFGNNPSLGGGALDVDRRCNTPAPRTEIARFLAPRPGRYRVGVSYDRACGFRRDPVAFEVIVEGEGVSLTRKGVVDPGEFEHIVLEFDLPPPGEKD